MHSSKEQQQNRNPSPLGTDIGQFFLGSLFGPVADLAVEAAQISSEIYTDRFEAAARKAGHRTNGHEGGYRLGARHSLGQPFNRACAQAENKNEPPRPAPYWKRDPGPLLRPAA